MLVLSRKAQQKIVIPTLGITLTVLRVGSGRVQIGIEAPRDIRIARPDANRHDPDDAVAEMAEEYASTLAECFPVGA